MRTSKLAVLAPRISEFRASGITDAEIARILRISRSSIGRIVGPGGVGNQPKDPKLIERARKLWLGEFSQREIAARLGVSIGTIAGWARRHNFPARVVTDGRR